jgi:hypothetical protein
LPKEWPDPLRSNDKGKPDLGVVPLGAEAARVGVRGRLSQFGAPMKPIEAPASAWAPFKPVAPSAGPARKAALVEGYPEIDAPLIRFALRKQGVAVDDLGHAWLLPKEYSKYSTVILAGDLNRAQIKPNVFAEDDLPHVRRFLEEGGTLWLTNRAKRVFDWTPAGQKFLIDLIVPGQPKGNDAIAIKILEHSWVKHLKASDAHAWLTLRKDNDLRPWRAGTGERILASADGACLLYRLQVGKGQLIYMGWHAMAALPPGKTQATLEQEQAFTEQAQILFNVASDLNAHKFQAPRQPPKS